MTVSGDHQELVTFMASWCVNQYPTESLVFLVDDVGTIGGTAPPKIRGFMPDVTCMTVSGFFEVIGEAKTRDDLATRHTRSQLKSFLETLRDQEGGRLLICVPWGSEGTAASILRHIQNNIDDSEKRWKVLSPAPR